MLHKLQSPKSGPIYVDRHQVIAVTPASPGQTAIHMITGAAIVMLGNPDEIADEIATLQRGETYTPPEKPGPRILRS